MDGLYLPPKPAIILPKPRELVRPADPRFRVPPLLLAGMILNPYSFGGLVPTNADASNMTVLGSATVDAFSAGAYTSGNNDAACRTTTAKTGDFTWQATVGSGQLFNFGCFDSSEVATFSAAANGSGGLTSMTNSFHWGVNAYGGTLGIYKGGSRVDTSTYTNGDTVKVTRVGSTIAWFKNGSLIHTHAATYSGSIHLCVMHAGGTVADGTSVFWEN